MGPQWSRRFTPVPDKTISQISRDYPVPWHGQRPKISRSISNCYRQSQGLALGCGPWRLIEKSKAGRGLERFVAVIQDITTYKLLFAKEVISGIEPTGLIPIFDREQLSHHSDILINPKVLSRASDEKLWGRLTTWIVFYSASFFCYPIRQNDKSRYVLFFRMMPGLHLCFAWGKRFKSLMNQFFLSWTPSPSPTPGVPIPGGLTF